VVTRRFGRLATVLVATVSLGLLGACGGDDGGGDVGSAPGADGSKVALKGIVFRPETLEVDAGTTVTWTNEDATAHTVTSGTVDQGGGGVTKQPDGRFDSKELPGGEGFTFTFDRPGTYPYYCALHPATMQGQITVR
jgi:plastocyanin